MRSKSSQPAVLHTTAKTHKFEKLIFRPIDQTGTATYDATKATGEYLNTLACSECKISYCLKVPDMLKSLPYLQKDEEYVSYNVDSLFTKIP